MYHLLLLVLALWTRRESARSATGRAALELREEERLAAARLKRPRRWRLLTMPSPFASDPKKRQRSDCCRLAVNESTVGPGDFFERYSIYRLIYFLNFSFMIFIPPPPPHSPTFLFIFFLRFRFLLLLLILSLLFTFSLIAFLDLDSTGEALERPTLAMFETSNNNIWGNVSQKERRAKT